MKPRILACAVALVLPLASALAQEPAAPAPAVAAETLVVTATRDQEMSCRFPLRSIASTPSRSAARSRGCSSRSRSRACREFSRAIGRISAEHRFRVGRAELVGFARLNNLLDREIIGSLIVNESNGRYFEPAPGRLLVAGLRATLGGESAP